MKPLTVQQPGTSPEGGLAVPGTASPRRPLCTGLCQQFNFVVIRFMSVGSAFVFGIVFGVQHSAFSVP